MKNGQFARARSWLLGGFLVGGLIACSGQGAPAGTATPPTPTASPPVAVQVWLTTADQTHLLERQENLYFGALASRGPVIYVNEDQRYQQMDGFGASMTDSSAWLIYTQMPEEQRRAVMTALFSPTEGIGISALRIPMGASDFVHDQPYTYDDMPPGHADPELIHFSIDHDRAYILPALRDALRLRPDLKLIASPWSPPAWMKTSDSLFSGTLKEEYYPALAQYFVRFLQAYQAEGVPVYAITIQNEPYYEPYTYPGMRLEPADEAEFVKNHLGPALRAAGLDTKILIWDHNWDKWRYPLTVLGDAEARAFVHGTAFHCYAGTVLAQTIVHDAYPDKDIYFTECSGGTWVGGFAAGFTSDMKNLVIGATRNWARTVIKWNLALDPSHNPHYGGCATCDGLVTIDPDAPAGFTYNFDYYTIGHLSKFVQVGAYRIASSTYPDDGLESVAFRNPDGSKALVVANFKNQASTFSVRWGDLSFEYTLPPNSAATFLWSGEARYSSPPMPPNDVKAMAVNGKMVLKWEFSPLARTYTIQRADQPGGPYAVIASGIGLPEYHDSAVEAGRTYYYVIRAVNEWGESSASREIAVTP